MKRAVTWAICTTSVNYKSVVPTVIPIYKWLIERKYRILVYSGMYVYGRCENNLVCVGDTDGAVPYTGTEAWIRSMYLSSSQTLL